MKRPVKEIKYSPEELATIQDLEQAEKNYRPIKFWTETEIYILKRFYGKVASHTLQQKLHRSSQSIIDKASALGLGAPGRSGRPRK